MKLAAEKGNLEEAIKGANLSARKKAFKNHLPYAVLRNDIVILVYPDEHTEEATPERLKELHLTFA